MKTQQIITKFFVLLFLLQFNAQAIKLSVPCNKLIDFYEKLVHEVYEIKQRNSVINRVIRKKNTQIVAHGDLRLTWEHFVDILDVGKRRLGAIEVDLQHTKDGKFVLLHHSTMHDVAEYTTPVTDVQRYMREEFPHLPPHVKDKIESPHDPANVLLFDNTRRYTLDELEELKVPEEERKFRIVHNHENTPDGQPLKIKYKVISFDEFLQAFKDPKKVKIPAYISKEDAQKRAKIFTKPGKEERPRGFEPMEIEHEQPIALYLDLKEPGFYSFKKHNLPGLWNWQKEAMSDQELKEDIRKVIDDFVSAVERNDAFSYTFPAIRHKDVAKMVNERNPKIQMMASPDVVKVDGVYVKESRETTIDQLIEAFDEMLPYHPKIFEVKYLRHIMDPKLHAWAEKNNVKLFFNQLRNVDYEQFEGAYAEDFIKLMEDTKKHDINGMMIQTDTIKKLRKYLKRTEDVEDEKEVSVYQAVVEKLKKSIKKRAKVQERQPSK